MSLEDDIRRTVASDPAGFSEISHRDTVLYIANGVYSARAIKEYIEAGIGPEQAGDIEILSD